MPPSSPVSPATPPVMSSDSLPVATKVIGIIIVLAVLGGLYYWYTSSKTSAPAATTTDNRPASVRTQTSAQPSSAANTDTSNAALVKDSAAVDAQLTGLSSDTSAMGAVDQPIQQAF